MYQASCIIAILYCMRIYPYVQLLDCQEQGNREEIYDTIKIQTTVQLQEIAILSCLHFEGKFLDMKRYNFCQTEDQTETTLHAAVSVILQIMS